MTRASMSCTRIASRTAAQRRCSSDSEIGVLTRALIETIRTPFNAGCRLAGSLATACRSGVHELSSEKEQGLRLTLHVERDYPPDRNVVIAALVDIHELALGMRERVRQDRRPGDPASPLHAMELVA